MVIIDKTGEKKPTLWKKNNEGGVDLLDLKREKMVLKECVGFESYMDSVVVRTEILERRRKKAALERGRRKMAVEKKSATSSPRP